MKKHTALHIQQTIDAIIDNFVWYGQSKSGGHGGQKVNKKRTKAELYFDINKCDLLSDDHKEQLTTIYHKRVNHDGILRMSSAEERHLHSNKKIVTKHFDQLMTNILSGNPHHLRGWHDSKHHH